MRKTILYIFLSVVMSTIPVTLKADNPNVSDLANAVRESSLQVHFADVEIDINGNMVHVQNAQGCWLEVFDLTGKRVVNVRVDSQDKTLTLQLRKGCYILRVAKTTRKIIIS